MDRHGLRPRDDEVGVWPRDDEKWRLRDDEKWRLRDDEQLSLRGAKRRGSPCRHEVMDRHGLRPRDDEVGVWPRNDEVGVWRRDDEVGPRDDEKWGLRDDEVGVVNSTRSITAPHADGAPLCYHRHMTCFDALRTRP